MKARIEQLVGQGLARRQAQRVIFARDLLDTLRRRKLDEAAARMSESAGQVYHPATEGEPVAGTYRQRLDLASGRFAMIDDRLGFTLFPGPRHSSGILAGKSPESCGITELNGISGDNADRPSAEL